MACIRFDALCWLLNLFGGIVNSFSCPIAPPESARPARRCPGCGRVGGRVSVGLDLIRHYWSGLFAQDSVAGWAREATALVANKWAT